MNTIPSLLTVTMRIVLLFLALTAVAMLLFARAQEALAASLRPVAVLSGDTLTAGDLFTGLAPEKASHVLGPAPQPGQDMVLNARTLMRVALTLDLPWQPGSTADQVIVRRASTTVDPDIFTAILSDKMREQGVDGHFEISYTGSAPEIALPQGQPGTAELVSFAFDPKRDAFQAAFAAPSKDMKLAEVNVIGKVQRYVSVPVLANSLRAGDLIGARDISWIDIPVQEAEDGVILNEKDLDGMTPRRMIAAGKPIRDRDLQKPRLVARGDFVTLVYESGPIILTAKGKALQPGAHGDIVRIVNVSSNRALEGVVTGDRQISIVE